MVTKRKILKWLEQFEDGQEIDYTVYLLAETPLDVYLLDMDTGKTHTYTEPAETIEE